ncbi:hypothetical protein TNCV_568161 [Trichonephila clavipes]|nr:hypothetical protein TNCV_568161 [Trichonephila clavipes]
MARSTPTVGLELHTGDTTNWFGEISQRDDRWRHHLSHLHNLGMELKGREIFSSPLTRDSAHKTSDPLI